MEFRIRSGPGGLYYIPKKIRVLLGEEIALVPDDKAAILYSVEADLKEIVKSLEILLLELRLKAGRPDERIRLD